MVTQRPTGIILTVVWFFIAGLAAAAGGALHAFSYQTVFGWYGWLITLGGGNAAITQTIQILLLAIGVVLIAAGLGYWVTAVGLLQARLWGRTGGIITAVAAALGWIALGILLYFSLGILAGSTPIFYIVVGLFNLLPILYLMSDEVRFYCEGTGPTYPPGTTSPPVSAPLPPIAPAPPPTSSAGPRIPRTQAVNPPAPTTAWLVARNGVRPGKEYGLRRSENIIGRDSTQCDIVLDDSAVSKQHAKVRFEGGQFVVYDLGSRNGTRLNNRPIQKQSLLDGDELRVGNTLFVFKEVKTRPMR